jgi:hypothetical protein
MRMTAIHAQTERKRQDRFVRHAEKRRRRAVTLRVRGPIRKARGVCANTDTAQGEKRLFNWQIQANVTSSGRPLGECRFTGNENFTHSQTWVGWTKIGR